MIKNISLHETLGNMLKYYISTIPEKFSPKKYKKYFLYVTLFESFGFILEVLLHRKAIFLSTQKDAQ